MRNRRQPRFSLSESILIATNRETIAADLDDPIREARYRGAREALEAVSYALSENTTFPVIDFLLS